MKRQRNVDAENTKAKKGEFGAAASRTKSATMAEKKRKEVPEKVEEERKNGGESSPGIVEISNPTSLEDLPWLSEIFVDEQMSWGSTWLPFWDVDFMDEACTQMFSDVVWDYDIWNFRTTN